MFMTFSINKTLTNVNAITVLYIAALIVKHAMYTLANVLKKSQE